MKSLLYSMLWCVVSCVASVGGQQGDSPESGASVRAIITEALDSEGAPAVATLKKGVYHFYPDKAPRLSFPVSNHDQQRSSSVGIPLVGVRNLTIDGMGSTFVFHGKMQPFLLMDCENVTLKNITITYDRPYYVEGKIVEIERNGKTILEFGSEASWKVEKGRFRILREDGEEGVVCALPFEAAGPMVPMEKGGDVVWTDRAEQVAPHRVRFFCDASRSGLKPGHVLVLRHGKRPHPAILLYRVRNTRLEEIVFHDSQGMALLAQRSEGIFIHGGGCIAPPGRVHSVSADATHFSNCRGQILIEDALYEGMMDDAINVHSTCLAIERIVSPTELIARFMHRQTVGLELFLPGEQVQFILGRTLENHPDLCKVKMAEAMNAEQVRIVLDKPIPRGIGVGDAIENADWHPSVVFRRNTVRYNRARGCLFNTSGSVLVEGNKFLRSHGSAILLAGDAEGWYESGRCADVLIRGNEFDHNLTADYQFTHAIISICPEVREIGEQTERYHRNIRIVDNIFRTHSVPLLYAESVDGITWRDNTVLYDDMFPSRGEPKAFILHAVEHADISQPTHP